MAGGLSQLATEAPDRHLVSDHSADGETRSLTRSQFNERVNRAIWHFRELGIEEGGSAAVMAGNSIDFVTALTALALMDVSQVAVNWHLNDDETAYILESSESQAVVTDARYAETARRAAGAAGVDIVVELGDEFDRALEQSSADEPPLTACASAIYYTSGTTGRPKATRMAEMKTGLTVEELQASIHAAGYNADSVHLAMGPLYHGGPLMQVVRAIMVGGELHVVRTFDPELVLRVIDEYSVTHTLGVPTHFVRMLRLSPETRERYDVSSLKQVYHIAAMMPPKIKKQMIDWWGPVLVDAYGCSELGVITVISADEWLERPGSVGRPVPHFTLHIRDEEGTELPSGGVGTIWIESHGDADIVYLNDEDKTAACHRGPKEFTLFDMGYLDDDGYLFLVDRRVDMIISGGVNIYPAEIESALITHDDILDVGVFGVPDDEWGHAVKAAVRLAPNVPATGETETAIIEWARDHLAHYKVPRSIDFLDELPRYTNGKLHRRKLREPYWEAQEVSAS